MIYLLIVFHITTVAIAYALAFGTSSSIGTDDAIGVRCALESDKMNRVLSLCLSPFGAITLFAVLVGYLVVRSSNTFINLRLRWR